MTQCECEDYDIELSDHKRVMGIEAPLRDELNQLLKDYDPGGLLLQQAIDEIKKLRLEVTKWKQIALNLAELPHYMRKIYEKNTRGRK
jgi:hypothetical protein